jgi:hypothetical protein
MAWWWTPAIIGGVMLYAKSKTSAAYRWYHGTEDSAKSMPIALFLTKVSTGDTLPAPPAGNVWKPMELNFASSPFATPDTLVVNVLQSVTSGAPGLQINPATVNGFLTTQELVGGRMAGFFDKDALAQTAHVGEVLDRAQYLYAPQTAPDFGDMLDKLPNYGGGSAVGECHCNRMAGLGEAVDTAVGRLKTELRSKGLVLVPVDQGQVCKGDFVVTANCRLHVVDGIDDASMLYLREIHPVKGRKSHWHWHNGPPLSCAFGVRRA